MLGRPIFSGICLALLVASVARAQEASYPTKPVHIVVGYAPGGPTDTTARILAGKLQAALGQPFVVDNRPGAGSNLASEIVATSAPDGYTLMVAASQLTINSVLYRKLKFDAVKSFAPISEVMSSPAVLVVNPSSGIASLADVVARAKKTPGKITYASSGNGSVPHLAGELLKERAKIDIVHIPYRGAGLALTDLLGNQVTMYFMTALTAVQYVKSDKLRAIAVTSHERLPELPDVPTMAEAGVPGVDVTSWNGLFAPAGTPQGVIDKIYKAVASALASADVQRMFKEQAATVVGSDPAAFSKYIALEVKERGDFARSINLRLD